MNSPVVQIVPCASLTEGLLEIELFGRAASGSPAASGQRGVLEIASGGTVFLDDVGELSPKRQIDLHRFLETHRFTPAGGQDVVAADVRIIAASDLDLEEAVDETLLERLLAEPHATLRDLVDIVLGDGHAARLGASLGDTLEEDVVELANLSSQLLALVRHRLPEAAHAALRSATSRNTSSSEGWTMPQEST